MPWKAFLKERSLEEAPLRVTAKQGIRVGDANTKRIETNCGNFTGGCLSWNLAVAARRGKRIASQEMSDSCVV